MSDHEMGEEPPEGEVPEEPTGGGLFGDSDEVVAGEPSEEPLAQEPEPTSQKEPTADEETPPDEAPADAAPADGGGSQPPAPRPRWPWLVLGSLVVLILLIGWTKVVNTDSFCTACHQLRPAAATAADSIHSDVACISCHRGIGLPGAVAYIPTFARELVDQLTPLSVANGVMDSAPCSSCHNTVFTSPLVKGVHPTSGCDTCHGNTTHPTPSPSPGPVTNPHPTDWVQVHGREASANLQTCTTCHLTGSGGTCMTCHFKTKYPHPKDWITAHGQAQIEAGADACTLCHPPTFCASCHGTEIPHGPDWLKEHWSVLQAGYPTTPCLTCHAEVDCNRCHALHGVHNSQTIFDR